MSPYLKTHTTPEVCTPQPEHASYRKRRICTHARTHARTHACTHTSSLLLVHKDVGQVSGRKAWDLFTASLAFLSDVASLMSDCPGLEAVGCLAVVLILDTRPVVPLDAEEHVQ